MKSTMTDTGTVVRLNEVHRVYGSGRSAVHALRGLSLESERGTFTCVMGPSGSGKSTFLQCAAGLDRPSSGSVTLGGVELSGMTESELTTLRRDHIGFVFQAFNLLPPLTAQENVALPLRLAGRSPSVDDLRAALERVGMDDHREHRPAELSGGQQQRVAIARALVTDPAVLFADEPTGALDTGTAHDVLTLLRHLVTENKLTIVCVTHDPVVASFADRVVLLADGSHAGTLCGASPDHIATVVAGLGRRQC